MVTKMGKLYRSYYLGPGLIASYLFTLLVAAVVIYLTVFSHIFGDFISGILLAVIWGFCLYILLIRPHSLLKKFLEKLTPDEKKLFDGCLARYDRRMKFQDSGRFWIRKSLAVVDARHVVWIHPIAREEQPNKVYVVIYGHGSLFTPPFKSKPLLPITLPPDGMEQIATHVRQYNPQVLLGYTSENIDMVKRKYNTVLKNVPVREEKAFGSQAYLDEIFDQMFGSGAFGSVDVNRVGAESLMVVMTEQEAAKGCVRRDILHYTTACAQCGGSGDKNGRETRLCEVCGGTGRKTKPKKTPITNMVSTSNVCESCKGRGRLVDNPCGSCKGTGHSRTTMGVRIPPGVKTGSVMNINVPNAPHVNVKIKMVIDNKKEVK